MVLIPMLNKKHVAFHKKETYLDLIVWYRVLQRTYPSQFQHQTAPFFNPPIELVESDHHIFLLRLL